MVDITSNHIHQITSLHSNALFDTVPLDTMLFWHSYFEFYVILTHKIVLPILVKWFKKWDMRKHLGLSV